MTGPWTIPAYAENAKCAVDGGSEYDKRYDKDS
jgi:hypothetical protein